MSDIYLPREFVARLLEKNALLGPVDGLYVSSEVGLQKSTGALFDHVLAKEGLKPAELLHIGDSQAWDVDMPRKRGVRALHYEQSKLSRYEENLLHGISADSLKLSRFAGAVRFARLSCPYDNLQSRTVWEVTTNVSGPLMLGYVKWCLDRARALKLKRLYFLSRDGQVLLKLAEIVKQRYGFDIELRYLHVSRQALLFPALVEITDEELEWILAPTSLLTVRIVLKRINFEAEEFDQLLAEHGFDRSGYDSHLSPEERGRLRALLTDERVREMILPRAEQFRTRVLAYLAQEGVTADERFAVVDIGWNGTLQRSISRMLSHQGHTAPLRGFYFGLRRRLRFKESDELYAYFSDAEAPAPVESAVYIIPMVELFTAADHGVVLGYEQGGNVWQPILKSRTNEAGIAWGVGIQQEAMQTLAGIILDRSLELLENEEAYKALCGKNFADFILTPSRLEAEAYGAYPFREEQNDTYAFRLASKYSVLELLQHKRHGFKHHHDEWSQGALELSSPVARRLLGIANRTID